MPAHLEIARADQDGAAVFVARGEIDLASAPELELHVAGAIGHDHVVIDVTGITFIDSTGLRVLIAADEGAREAGGRLTLVAGPGPVTKLLDLTGVDRHLRVVDTQEAALATR